MIPRARLDIGWSDLAAGALAVLTTRNHKALAARVEHTFPSAGGAVATLSVRTGFDLLLRAAALPAGSEVLLSAVTIKDMARIIRAHGLVPVPVDIDPDTLEPLPASLERARSAQSKALLLTHLFGTHVRFDAAIAWARAHGLLVIEDIAQSFGGRDQRNPQNDGVYLGHEESHVRLFSFGPIKTETALGGALLLFEGRALRERTATLNSALPDSGRVFFAERVAKYSVLRLLSTPWIYGGFVRALRGLGKSHDDLVSRMTRGFAGGDLFARIRRRPSAPMLALFARRLRRQRASRLDARTQAGERVAARLAPGPGGPGGPGGVRRPGSRVPHTFWIFPVLSARPQELIRALWSRGFDATRGTSSLAVIETPPERPDAQCPNAVRMMEEIVFVPVYPEMRAAELDRLADAISAFERQRTASSAEMPAISPNTEAIRPRA